MILGMDTESLLALATTVCTTSFVVSTAITNFFDTPETPDEDDSPLYRAWYYTYKLAEMIRMINDRAKQRPDVAILLKKAVNKKKNEEMTPEEMMQLIEDLAYTVGTKRALEKADKSALSE